MKIEFTTPLGNKIEILIRNEEWGDDIVEIFELLENDHFVIDSGFSDHEINSGTSS